MPELPEVEVVRSGLEPAVTGATVTRVEVLDFRSLRRHDGPEEDFVDRLTGVRLLKPERRGKFLWIPVEPRRFVPSGGSAATHPPNGTNRGVAEALVVHLGMTGQVLLRDPDAVRDRLTRIVLDVDQPSHGAVRVDFVDQRIFGSMALDALVEAVDHPAQLIPGQVAHIARDPVDPLFDDDLFLRALAKRDTGIKRALLDQTLVSGIGNIYADEALWAARIHYAQPTRALSRPRAKTLLAEVRLVLGRALAEGGTSFDSSYVNVNGASGYFSHSLNAYGQHGKPCPRCGRPIVRDNFMNRGSHFCPFCQRAPR
ncbi:bifunctional DNA-formamidopyrimidine glycosylase/DNA-(apurinic or apyrimidinic site) lyase [Pseudolysinimonas sp.]|uniref:bifunctional DNA-formamidopyrimidine glycosylase/DNA-(apurinic or apyrimidinic site) lyase n=1 Tax=Pseudolysinimonas sp. TaxID=2680009 RepID=UPI00286B23B6|nr:bifunctional DNA-formamidopyrimidine glycosylase/DNA-(apurinic or apyrimidinic site) lyase [Pseudolysinimonas sp.]